MATISTTCAGTTKKGKRCRNRPVQGEAQCIAHLPRKDKDSLGFGGAQPGSGRPRNPKPSEVLRERVEADVEKVVSAYVDALVAEQDGQPAHSTRLRAARELLDRLYGRPRQEGDAALDAGEAGEGLVAQLRGSMHRIAFENPDVRELSRELGRVFARLRARDPDAPEERLLEAPEFVYAAGRLAKAEAAVAMQWALDRGAEPLEETIDLRLLTDDELDEYRRLLEIAAGQIAPTQVPARSWEERMGEVVQRSYDEGKARREALEAG